MGAKKANCASTKNGAHESGIKMAKLFGAQRLVLQTILDLPKDSAGFVTDSQIFQKTGIALDDVRDWIETLGSDGYVDFFKTVDGLSATITAKGRLQLSQYQPPDLQKD